MTNLPASRERVWMCIWLVLFLFFIFLAIEVAVPYNSIGTADLQFENALLAGRTSFFLSVFNWITLLGETAVVIALAIIAGIALWRSPRTRAYAAGLAVAVLGAEVSAYSMKSLVGRARPGGLISAITEASASFPSGHATLGMALYGFTAYFLCKFFPTKSTIIAVAASLLIAGIGFSRLYLGAHFPSDVLAGYLLGGLWLLIGVRVAQARICSAAHA